MQITRCKNKTEYLFKNTAMFTSHVILKAIFSKSFIRAMRTKKCRLFATLKSGMEPIASF